MEVLTVPISRKGIALGIFCRKSLQGPEMKTERFKSEMKLIFTDFVVELFKEWKNVASCRHWDLLFSCMELPLIPNIHEMMSETDFLAVIGRQ